MKFLLIVTILFGDGEKFTGPLTADQYSERDCESAKASIMETVDHRFKILAASCVTSTAI